MLKLSRGVTDFEISSSRITITHSGNMGATINDVKENTDHVFGKGTFDRLKANKIKEKGSPDYLYELTSSY